MSSAERRARLAGGYAPSSHSPLRPAPPRRPRRRIRPSRLSWWFAPGGPTDILARDLEILEQAFVHRGGHQRQLGVVFPANEEPALPLNPGEEALDEPASHVAA
jgi:hypothetical protein